MKRWYLISFIAILFVSLSACHNVPVSEEEVSTIQPENKLQVEKLKVGTMEIDPFMFIENGEMQGPNIDIVATALENIGYDYEFVILPWSRLLKLVRDGDLDMAYALYDAPDRRAYLDYVEEPIGLEELSFFVRTGSNITYDGNLDSISNYRIGIVQDYFYTEAFHAAMDANQITTDQAISTDNNIEKLLNGRVDMIIENEALVKHYLITKNLENQLLELEIPLSFNYSYITLSKEKDHGDLEQLLSAELTRMKQDGSFYNIFVAHGMSYYSDSFKARELSNPPPRSEQ